jgi:hypothetical protein
MLSCTFAIYNTLVLKMLNWLKRSFTKRKTTAPKAPTPPHIEIPIEQALRIAHGFAKPCVFLKKEGNKFAAVWGGAGTIAGPEGYEHWLSVDCSFLPQELGLTKGVISVYSGGEDIDTGVVKYALNASLELNNGVPLYAHSAISIPPPDISAELDTDSYMKAWQDNCPVYTGTTTAVIGGWHFPWPDGDWEELCGKQFVLWTIENSEPWLEVWKDGESFRVLERIT